MLNRLLLILCFFFLSCHSNGQEGKRSVRPISIPKTKIVELKTYLQNHKKYNQETAIFINFKIPSQYYRFFIYDLKNDKILDKSLVSHGSGSEVQNSDKLVFSNTENSYQSSLGKYEIANRYKGQFGWSYRLKGLDKTNSNAMKRAIVLHPYHKMRSTENGEPSCLSLGCPMLSPDFFKKTEKYIEQSPKPMIIYAFY